MSLAVQEVVLMISLKQRASPGVSDGKFRSTASEWKGREMFNGVLSLRLCRLP